MNHQDGDNDQQRIESNFVNNWFWLVTVFLEVLILTVLQKFKEAICARNHRGDQPEPVQIINFIQVNNFIDEEIANEDSEEELEA